MNLTNEELLATEVLFRITVVGPCVWLESHEFSGQLFWSDGHSHAKRSGRWQTWSEAPLPILMGTGRKHETEC